MTWRLARPRTSGTISPTAPQPRLLVLVFLEPRRGVYVMSLARLHYLRALLTGWAALLAWLVCELAGGQSLFRGFASTALLGLLIGTAPTAAQALVAPGDSTMRRLLGGLLFGLVGGLLGGGLSAVQLPWVLVCLAVGLGVGAAEGVVVPKPAAIVAGLAAGAMGGLLGWALGQAALHVLGDGVMGARATAYVLVGLAVGASVAVVPLLPFVTPSAPAAPQTVSPTRSEGITAPAVASQRPIVVGRPPPTEPPRAAPRPTPTAAPAPPRPAPTAAPTPAAQPRPAVTRQAPSGPCPTCGQPAQGPPGRRYCVVCDATF